MKPWADANHESYHRSRKRGKHSCLGCGKPCTYSDWGPWCHPCNVKRLTNINASMAQLARNLRDEATAQELEDKP